MHKIILQKIDRILENSKKNLLHIPPCSDGKYFFGTDGKYTLDHILSVNQAYITGMAILAYLETCDKKYLDWCNSFYDEYFEKVGEFKYDTSCDVGLLYSLYAVPMYKLTDEEKYKRLALLAADELVRRFVPNLGYLRAWGRANANIPPYIDKDMEREPFFCENRGLVLIESCINLPILLWAADETRQYIYSRVAESHINIVRKYLIRSDYTTSHGYRFEEFAAKPYCEENYFGYSKGSYWAKGAAVAIYSFIKMHKYSGNPERAIYINTASSLLNTFIDRCAGSLPVWDFDSPDKATDTQAAAIALCAVKEFRKYRDCEKLSEFEKMLSEGLLKYIDKSMETDGILKGQNGREEYDIAGDFFFLKTFLDYNGIDIW